MTTLSPSICNHSTPLHDDMSFSDGPCPDEAKDCLVWFRTSQVIQFKTLLDVLKDLLTEVNLEFGDKGFKVISLDPGKIGMIHLSVHNLEAYYCPKPCHAGVYISYLYKILRTVTTNHHMEIRIRESDPKILEVILTNADKRVHTIHHLKLLDLDVEEIKIPEVQFECVVSMPSADLQKYVKELSHVSNLITIRGSDNKICFISRGDMGETCIEVAPTPSGLNWLHKDMQKKTFESTFFLKYVERFSKSTCDSTVELYFRQGYPLIMRYEMTIGSLRFCIAPISPK